MTVSSCMSGPGGGSGGTGGCGGSGGVGGHAGGSSIALASADAHVTIANTNLRAGAGGAGGRGARGQIGGQGGTGQAGGAGAPGGVSDACAGGNGGKGGNGGPGGGGRGGHSLGIASHGAPVTRGAGVFIATGMAGGGGLDGSDTTANAGDDGKAADELDFSAAP